MKVRGDAAATIYRADIDGLRALAVLSVLIYHLDRSVLPGGFVGVDIFFVISGFLITRNIWSEMLADKFSFGSFYLKRIRRIAPAYFFTVGVTLLAGSVLLLPADLSALAQSALWGAFSASNIYFWLHLDTSYFASSSSEVPLLHTWSLGVEEQFYFIWPTLLIFAAKFAHRRFKALTLVLLLCAGSFIWAELTNIAAQKFAYYMLPTRAGELMIGAMLAIGGIKHASLFQEMSIPRWCSEALAIGGLGLFVYSLFWINDATDFPGVNALFPSIATAMLIISGGAGSRLALGVFTPRPIVTIGLISYSLYLWHWPVLAFFRYFYGDLDQAQMWIALALMALLSFVSYRYVERPARQWQATKLRQALVLYAMPLSGAIIFSAIIIATGGFYSVINSLDGYRVASVRVHEYTAPASDFKYNCQGSKFDPSVLQQSRCVLGSEPNSIIQEPATLLWGDSEAAHYIGVLGMLAKQSHFRFRNATLSACPPIFGGDYGDGWRKLICDKFRPFMQKAILSGSYDTVIMSGAWGHYSQNANFKRDVETTISSLVARNIRVILVGEVPYLPAYNRECELRAIRIGGADCETRASQPDHGLAPVDRYLSTLASADKGVYYVDVRSILCAESKCGAYLDGRSVYFNSTHLSMSGSWLIGEKLLRAPRELERWQSAITGGRNADALESPGVAQPNEPGADPVEFDPRHMSPILGGYAPDFPYHLRSARNIDSRAGPGAVVIEFWGVPSEVVANRIRRSLTLMGYLLKSTSQASGTIKMHYVASGRPDISVTVGPFTTLNPQSPMAKGMVYMRW